MNQCTCQHTNYSNTTNIRAWTALVMWYMCCKLAPCKILQNFWLKLLKTWNQIARKMKKQTVLSNYENSNKISTEYQRLAINCMKEKTTGKKILMGERLKCFVVVHLIKSLNSRFWIFFQVCGGGDIFLFKFFCFFQKVNYFDFDIFFSWGDG